LKKLNPFLFNTNILITMIYTSLILSALIESVRGHGRLIRPVPRVGDSTSYENDPVGFVRDPTTSMDQFICRHASPSNVITAVDAGSQLEVQWDLTAAHPGDCSFYISYDFDKDPLEMEWFKVANLMDCKSVRMYQGAGTQDTWQFELPSWLPRGRAVLRWEWAALHIPTSVEFFVQCVDIEVTPSADEISIANIPTYKVYDPTTPRAANYGTAAPGNGVTLSLPMSWEDTSSTPNVKDVYPNYPYSYRSAYNVGADWPSFMTGPACALGLTINNCELTAADTAGYVPMDESNATPVTVPTSPPVDPEPEDPVTDAPTDGPAPYPTEHPENGDLPYPFYFSSTTTMEQRKTMANIAGLLAQCMWESGGQAPWSACDENNYTGWSSASCTQRQDGQLYADLGADDGSDGSCPRDNGMTMTAETAASWTPGPMKCEPGTETEGCCWWGRGAIQTTGRFNYGQLQKDVVSKLGLYEADGSSVDLCTNPEAMCQHEVLKMSGALYYWTSMVQKESCFNSALDTIAQDFNIDAAPSAQCYEFSKGVGGAINNGIWNSYPHGEYGRKTNMQNLINAIVNAFDGWNGYVNYDAYECTGDSVIDTLLDLANIDSVSQLDSSPIYSWEGFCASLRAFIPGAPVDYPTQPPVDPTEEPTNEPEYPTDAPVNPTEPPTEPPIDDGECVSVYEKYEQCGGSGFVPKTGSQYDGCPTCPAGTQCYAKSQWYSGCTEVCPSDWDCAQGEPVTTETPETTTPAPATTEAPEPTTPAVETTTPPAETTTPSVAPGSCPNAAYDTCGGEGQVIGSGAGQWSGETCCQAGLECVAQSQWHSMCVSTRRMELVAPQ